MKRTDEKVVIPACCERLTMELIIEACERCGAEYVIKSSVMED